VFLSHYASTFPFKIENQIIYADEEYTQSNIKFITCVPHPQNYHKGMVIYTALSNKYIFENGGINTVFHGPQDYVLFLNRSAIKTAGMYNKNEKWEFYK